MAQFYGPAAGDFLRMSADRYPDRRCLVLGDGTSWTFAETNRRVNQLVDVMVCHGIGRGDRVAIFAVNGVGYAEVLFACLKLGATYVPLNNRLTPAETGVLVERAAPAAVFTDLRYLEAVRPALAVGRVRLAVAFDGDADGFVDYETLLSEGNPVEPTIVVEAEDIVGLAFTSGTTGLPKGVLQSQRMIRNLTTAITLDYEIQPDEFRYSSSPMFHIGGQTPLFMHAWRGFPTLLLPQFDVDRPAA
jgi:acyl-CoA synthetase (AMP-forming)/AMP-acid ligase II